MSAKSIQRRLVRDRMRNRVGEVMAANAKGTVLYLRPPGGGLEWEVPADQVQDLPQAPEGGEDS